MENFRSILFLISGLIVGFTASSYLERHDPPAIIRSAMEEITDRATNRDSGIEQQYAIKLDSLQKTNEVLAKQAATTKTALQKAKYDNRVLQQLVDTIAAHENTASDTAEKLAACDSLEAAVVSLSAASDQKDSLYDELVNGLRQEVSNKDSTVAVQEEAYRMIRMSFENSLARQELLSGENTLLQKQLKQCTLKNKALSAGVFVLSGIAVYSLLKH